LKDKVVLAYSGGLDTSVAIKWIADKYDMDVIALSIDLGMERDYESIRQKALKVGAIKAEVIDAKDVFINEYVFPALQADAIYEGQYTLATALARPLIAKLLVETALQEGATAIAHGCTGKGNDQVRFDVSTAALAPQLKVIGPAREWGMTREETIEYAKRHGIPVPVTVASPYSIDENLWGKSIECGVLEDPWVEPPEEVFTWTKSPADAPDEPRYVEIGFERGIPTGLDGQALSGVALVEKLNSIAGEHGVGRVDHLENRLVGIKSREIYEAPADDPIPGPAPLQGKGHPGICRPYLQRPLVLGAATGPRRLRQEYAAARQRDGQGQDAQGQIDSGRSQIAQVIVQLQPGHLR
jgi:argininosuccinate synthase